MRRSLVLRAWVALCACVWVAGCPSAAKDEPTQGTAGSGLLAACGHDDECASKLCTYGLYSVTEEGVCSKTCSSDADCKSSMGKHATCSKVAAIPELDADADQSMWRKACVLPCEESDPGVFECKHGERLFCQDDSPPSCKVCGCSQDSFCDAGDQRCKAYRHGREACVDNGECLSGLCEDGLCTSGVGDPCDDHCDGTCGGAADALYCMPACTASRCPVRLHGWECLGDPDAEQFCGRVCKSARDCIADGDVCEPFPEYKAGGAWPYYFTGFCHQPR